MAVGIEERHSRSCRSRQGRRCDCEPSYQAHVWDGQKKQRIRRTFPNETAAKTWRKDALIAIRRGRSVQGPLATTLEAAAEAWLEGAHKGSIRTRSGDRYKPSAVRSYERALRLRVLPTFGNEPLADIRRGDLQDLADELVGQGLSPSTIQATLIPLRSIFRREVSRGRIGVNPTSGLELPAVRGGRERIASPEEAAQLLAALPLEDQAVWATAMYAGLRRGELRALPVAAIDFGAGVIHVDHGWDEKEGRIETKGRNRRKVPIASVLKRLLLEHLARSGRRGGDLAFGATATSPFAPTPLTERADAAWKAAGLERITLHECRHTFASLMIAAGVNAKALSTYMGHANIAITLDRYAHLMPGNEDEAAGLLDTYLQEATG